MKLRRLLVIVGRVVVTLLLVAVLVGSMQLVLFSHEADQVYPVEPLRIEASTDSAVIARGKHIAESYGECTGCHGDDLGGRVVEDIELIGIIRAPNLTRGRGGVGDRYTDGELARAIRHGLRDDGRSLVFMPTPQHAWWPDADVQAVVSFVRSMPPVDSEVPRAYVRPFGRILHSFGVMNLLSASQVRHEGSRERVPPPSPTAAYGQFLARGCSGCHGENFSGGPIPGAPPSLPIPANLTRHRSGLGSWSREQFFIALNTGVRPNGRKLDPFMPVQSTRHMTELEKTALWEYLRSVEPREFGGR